MTPHPIFRFRRQGSALLTVIFFVFILAMLTGSMLIYSVSERRSNERERLLLRARNMAENVAIYASEQLTTKLYRVRSFSPMAFMTGSNQVFLPPDAVTTTSFSSPSDVECRAGLTSSTGYQFIDPNDPANAGNPNAGLQVSYSTVPIVAKATMHHPSIGALTAYAEQDLQVAMIPLFQFAVFYNMDMEFGPGPNMTISGPVHTNGNLIARIQTGFANTLRFTDRVTAAGGFYANTAHKGPTIMADGSADSGPGGSGPLYFRNPSGTETNIKSGSTWRDHVFSSDPPPTKNETATSLNQFKTFATSTYSGNLRTSVHGVTALVLPDVGGYKETDDPSTPEDDRKNGRQIIEAPVPSDSATLSQVKIGRRAGLYIIVNPDDETRVGKRPDGTDITMLPRSYRCFLNTVNADDSHTMREVILPGQPSYGYDGASSMYQNNLPNRYTDKTAIGVNQVLRIPASGRACDQPMAAGLTPASPHLPPGGVTFFVGTPSTTGYKATYGTTGNPTDSSNPYRYFADAFFYDLRRSKNASYPSSRSASNPFQPRLLAKVDFDLTRFRVAVERTYNEAAASPAIYNPNVPNGPGWTSANWSNSILNSAATTTTYNLGINYGTITDYSGFPTATLAGYFADPFRIYFAPGDPADTRITDNPSVFAVHGSDLSPLGAACPWYDGVTVYIHSVDAENHALGTGTDPARIDSGVRLWNGRGRIVSLTTTGRTGFAFCTNDAVYIVGHFNADGTIDSSETDTGTGAPDYIGGYSGRYREASDERLASVMGDALTILSQPLFTHPSGTTYYQAYGWADSESGARCDGRSGYSSSWATSNPSSGNTTDGTDASITAASAPNLSDTADHPGSGSGRTYKFQPSVTEVSSCLLTGIVPTTGSQTSGGVHNFPRLQESWGWSSWSGGAVALYIRGSMVAMFQSQVATEPWSIRYYQGAIRAWGLHQSLRDVNHDVPLEPMVLNAQRMRYREITPADYAAMKTTIEALPH